MDNYQECPCRYCTTETGRSPTCHSTCKDYLKWALWNGKRREKLREQKQLENFHISVPKRFWSKK